MIFFVVTLFFFFANFRVLTIFIFLNYLTNEFCVDNITKYRFRLVCAVNYKSSADEKMYFRKFFKFPVTKPIDVRTKFYNAEVY